MDRDIGDDYLGHSLEKSPLGLGLGLGVFRIDL